MPPPPERLLLHPPNRQILCHAVICAANTVRIKHADPKLLWRVSLYVQVFDPPELHFPLFFT